MAQGTAPKRSIDEIIGSIRSIVDRTEPAPRPVANDDIRADIEGSWRDTSDLMDVPDLPRVAPARNAEPVAPPPVEPPLADPFGATTAVGAPSFADGGDEVEDDLDPIASVAAGVDPAQMAEIAAAVERNLVEVAEATREVSGFSHAMSEVVTEPILAAAPSPAPMPAANDAPTFGRRGVPAAERTPIRRPAPVQATHEVEDANGPGARPDASLDDDLAAALETFLADEAGAREDASDETTAAPPSEAVAETPVAVDPRFQALREKVATPPPPPAPSTAVAALMPPPSPAAPQMLAPQMAPALAGGVPTIADPQLSDELLRPIIREWLDDNLPPLVERLVREELERAVSGRRAD